MEKPPKFPEPKSVSTKKKPHTQTKPKPYNKFPTPPAQWTTPVFPLQLLLCTHFRAVDKLDKSKGKNTNQTTQPCVFVSKIYMEALCFTPPLERAALTTLRSRVCPGVLSPQHTQTHSPPCEQRATFGNSAKCVSLPRALSLPTTN